MTDVLEKSVTRDDYAKDPRAGVFHLVVPNWYGAEAQLLPPNPPAWWSPGGDGILTMTLGAEDMWAGAIYKAMTKNIALDWMVADSEESARRLKAAQDLFDDADGGQGWIHFGFRHLGDYLTCDNGAFVEIERASDNKGARALGLHHLDSFRCRRTGNIETPVIYTDLMGREHELKWYQVLTFSDMPSGRAGAFGVGRCAARRAYRTIYKMAGLERYISEKITGDRANAITIIRGVTPQQLEDAIKTHQAEAVQRGAIAYKGKILIPMMGNHDIDVADIELAGVPDGFDAKQERDNAYVKYANAMGVAVQDIQPLSGQGLGTGTQSLMLDEAAQGQGIAAWRKQWMHMVNSKVLSTATTFTFNANDLRDQKAKAEVQKLREEIRTSMIANQTISVEQARQMAADDKDIPKEYLAQDQTPGGTLSDTEKPVDPSMVQHWPVTPTPAPAAPGLVTKADDDPRPAPLRRLLKQVRRAVEAMTDNLEAGEITPDQWRTSMADTLTTAYPRAYKAGAGADPDDQARAVLEKQVAAQLDYLNNFAIEIKAEAEWRAGWNARAEMYADSIIVPYWTGATKMLPLPAMPGEGTQCLTRCKCLWDVQQLDGDGNYDAYWMRHASESCQTCVQRSAEWGPLKIRNGRLM